MNRGTPPHLKKKGGIAGNICITPPLSPSYPWNSKANKN